MKENQETITKWQSETFGETTAWAAFTRMQKEYWELRDMLHAMDGRAERDGDMPDEHAVGMECADVLITLYRVAESVGIDLAKMVDEKMRINRARKWVVDGTGNGQHVKESP